MASIRQVKKAKKTQIIKSKPVLNKTATPAQEKAFKKAGERVIAKKRLKPAASAVRAQIVTKVLVKARENDKKK